MAKYSTESIYLYLLRCRRTQSPMTIRAIQQHFGIASLSTVIYHLQKLTDAGLIRRDRYRSSGIRIVDVDPDAARHRIRKLGKQ